MKKTLIIITIIFLAVSASVQADDFYFFDDFESGLTEWTIGGRQLAGQNVANTVSRYGSMMGHLYKTSFTEVTFERTFEYNPLLRFSFDMEVRASSQSAPSAYYGMAVARIIFADGVGERLGDVMYGTATTSYIVNVAAANPTRSYNPVSSGVLQHYDLTMDELLSQITIDEIQVSQITLEFRCYSSTYPYPSVSAELWVDNLTATDIPETSNQPPVAQCQNVTVEAGPGCVADADVDNGSFDPDGDAIIIEISPVGPYPLGETVVTLTVTDDSGASDSCEATVTVVDTTPPTIICPDDVTAEQESHDGTVVPLQATATDICDPNPVITSDELAIYPLGETVVTFTATDTSGNSASCSMTVTVLLPVAIDIKPTSCPNPLNVKSKGVLPVAVLGSENFDVFTIDLDSILLEGVAPIRSSYEDVSTPISEDECACTTEGADGFLDLILKFDTQEIVAALGDVEDGEDLPLSLLVTLIDGTVIEGSDCVRVIKKDKD